MIKHLLKILDIQHIRDGKIIWEKKNILNTFHLDGEQFILSTIFNSVAGITVPNFFYLGMDNRSTISVSDNMQSLTTEPTGNGYSRQAVSSATGFTVEENSGHWRAKSQTVSFSASGSSWGPVSNVFLTDRSDDTGYLISTAPLGVTRTIAPTDAITFKFSVSLANGD